MQIYLPIAEMPVDVLFVLGMSAIVGFISGMFGIGGGFLMTPLLIFIGIPPAIAVASQTAQIVASSTTSSITAFHRQSIDFKLGSVLVAGGFIGSILGIFMFAAARRAGQLDLVIVVSYVLLFLIVGSLMLRESIKDLWFKYSGRPRQLSTASHHASYLGWPLRMRFPRSKLYCSVIPVVGLAFFIGFIGALLGVGGGFILVPALLYLFRVPTSVVVGTSQFQIVCTSLVALILHALTNQAVDIILALLLIIGGVFGAQIGARIAKHLKAEMFRLLLALLLLAVGIQFAFDLFVPPKEPFSISASERLP
ncbi:sulfite exporter TauE/SafE family protein [Microvirga sp. W0021]|uniref:Probable membrane transporter protein n=1 Tax=Hohaiivirga grylli TaxID=3133970 RepID=A0ABV0BHL7_9HYPH